MDKGTAGVLIKYSNLDAKIGTAFLTGANMNRRYPGSELVVISSKSLKSDFKKHGDTDLDFTFSTYNKPKSSNGSIMFLYDIQNFRDQDDVYQDRFAKSVVSEKVKKAVKRLTRKAARIFFFVPNDFMELETTRKQVILDLCADMYGLKN